MLFKMNITCKNCNTSFEGNYCPNCGQTADTHKLNHHFIWHDIQHGFLHFDKGIFYTAKELFTRPGHFIREYIEGKRVKHFKPISLVIILATLYGVSTLNLDIKLVNIENTYNYDRAALTFKDLNHWVSLHYSWIILFILPVRAVTTFIIFRKQGYNYYEHIVLATYLASQRLIISIFVIPLDYWLNNTTLLATFLNYSALIEIIFSIWGHTQFFNKLSKPKAILLSILSWLLFIAFLVLCLMIVFSIMNIKF
jgi:hypothetical protein